MNSIVTRSLAELDMKLRRETTYLNSKLETANDDQKKFFELFLSSRNPKSLLERFYGLFSAMTPEEEDYENIKYYVSNLMHFSSLEHQ
jgi:Uma2 family endonuclease